MLAQSTTVVSWGGSYARASQEAYHKPFAEETGIEIRLEDYNGGLAQIRAQVEAGVVYWDVVDLEFALMADGVAIEDVYAVMDTEEGLARAFRKLDTIKDRIVWWEAGAQPPQMLADGEVVMTTAYNGRIFNAQVLEDQPFVIVWDGQVLDSGPMGIVAGTPRLAEALQFVQIVAQPASMARISQYIAYSPVRRSAEALVSTHLETGMDMLPHMPNTPEHTQRALRNDWAWWSDNGDEMNERFIVWLSQ